MQKRYPKILIILFVLVCACIFLPHQFSNSLIISAASNLSVSGNKIILTGLTGTSTTHFFYDAGNNSSTLVNATTKDCGGKYYSIVPKVKGVSSGYCEFTPTSDMHPFIEAGILYASASAKVSTNNGAVVSLTIATEQASESVSSTDENVEIFTPLVKIENLGNVKFSFNATTSSANGFVMDEPTIHLYTEIDSLTLEDKNIQATPGQMVKINAYNTVTKLTGDSGNFMSFSKINHEINFEFDSSSVAYAQKYVTVVGTNISIAKDAPDGVIKFRAFANKNSYSSNKIYSSNYATITINSANKINLTVTTDFASPATIVGEGVYNIGERYSLTITPNAGFKFVAWWVDGKRQTTSRRLVGNAAVGQEIYAELIKDVTVKSFSKPTKIYDGTTIIDAGTVSVAFDGIEPGHELGLGGITYNFANAKAGSNKTVLTSFETLTLTGAHAKIYNLKSQILPSIVGEIKKRDVEIVPSQTQKEYGNGDPIIKYTAQGVLANESLLGNLGREGAGTPLGEQLGKYNITLGTLIENNTNYNFTLTCGDAYFEIKQRTLSLTNVAVLDKVYDGNTSATITANLTNIFNNEDVYVELTGQFVSNTAGTNKEVVILSTTLLGENKDNYILKAYTQTLRGTIKPKEITVTALECSFVYGEEIDIKYSANLVNDDKLFGSLTIGNTNVGTHKIQLGNLANPNYAITNFISAGCTILPRTAYVTAFKKTKFYGDADPLFSYATLNLVNNDTLSGKIMREEGEDIGSYKLNKGSLYNENYIIEFNASVLEIKQRKIDVEIEFLNKTYDGTTDVNFNANFKNNIKNENFELLLKPMLSSANVGNANVTILTKQIICSNPLNYYFEFNVINNQIKIEKRIATVFIANTQKFYGDSEPEIDYSINNLVLDDVINIELQRNAGEVVGQYAYNLNIINGNPNYSLVLAENYFEILPRPINVFVKTQSKFFGDDNPAIAYEIEDAFCFNDTTTNVIDGEITREIGEDVGVYAYNLTTLSTNINYTFVNTQNSNFLILKRPVVVTSFATTKVYGDDDPVFNYSVVNDIAGQRLSVNIMREFGEDVGSYKLICETTFDERYSIEFVEAYLTITPCNISLRADDKIKIYGDADPSYSVSITSGFLKNNDHLENIASGTLLRQEGENVDSYIINIGSFNLGKNYNITFSAGTFEIIKRNITISAQGMQKFYGEADPELNYEISLNGLAFNDQITGSLARQPGEDANDYEILIGSIKINDNYIVQFESNTFKILKRQIEVIPTTLSKFYGEAETNIAYTLNGTLVNGDVLSGNLFRERDTHPIEETGKYKIYCTLANKNYNIIFNEWYFTILPREIVIKAQSYTINYGEADPELEYVIVSGSILSGHTLEGGLYKRKGNTVGEYEIISTLNLGRNYNIKFIAGTVTILPLNLTIKTTSSSYTKIYGQDDPSFNYTITSGKLINNDILYGAVKREPGENVGSYKLIEGVYNSNYNITLLPATLQILQKDVNMITSIYDKIYDGTTRAYLKNPYISGVIDDVYLQYDKNNCAQFESAAVGQNIPVNIYNISIVGNNAHNYNLILPKTLYANITLAEIADNSVSVSALDPVIKGNYLLNVTQENVRENVKIKNHNLVLKYNIWLKNDNEFVNAISTYTIKLNLPENVYKKSNIYVYQRAADGSLTLLDSKKQNGQLYVTASNLGEFYVTVEDESWINFLSTISLYVIGAAVVLCGLKIIIKHKKQKQK